MDIICDSRDSIETQMKTDSVSFDNRERSKFIMERRTKLIIPPNVMKDIRAGLTAMANEKPETSSGPLAEAATEISVLLDLGWSDAAIAARITQILQKAGYEDLVVAKHHISRLRKIATKKLDAKTETKNRPAKRSEKRSEEAKAEQEAPASTPTASPLTATNGPRTSRFGQSSGSALDR